MNYEIYEEDREAYEGLSDEEQEVFDEVAQKAFKEFEDVTTFCILPANTHSGGWVYFPSASYGDDERQRIRIRRVEEANVSDDPSENRLCADDYVGVDTGNTSAKDDWLRDEPPPRMPCHAGKLPYFEETNMSERTVNLFGKEFLVTEIRSGSDEDSAESYVLGSVDGSDETLRIVIDGRDVPERIRAMLRRAFYEVGEEDEGEGGDSEPDKERSRMMHPEFSADMMSSMFGQGVDGSPDRDDNEPEFVPASTESLLHSRTIRAGELDERIKAHLQEELGESGADEEPEPDDPDFDEQRIHRIAVLFVAIMFHCEDLNEGQTHGLHAAFIDSCQTPEQAERRLLALMGGSGE